MKRVEPYVAIRDLPKVVESMGFPKPHKAAGYRWFSIGARGKKLRTVLAGGKRFTRVDWIQNFLLNNEGNQTASTTLAPEATRVEQARNFLTDEGI